MLQTQIAQLDQIKGDVETKKGIEYRRRMDDLETELRNMEVCCIESIYSVSCLGD